MNGSIIWQWRIDPRTIAVATEKLSNAMALWANTCPLVEGLDLLCSL